MRRLVINDASRVIPFVDSSIGGGEHFPSDCYCLGVDEDGRLIGGVVFTNFDRAGVTLHSAGESAAWLNRMFLRAVFSYPFKQLKCRRMTTICRVDNPHAIKFAEKIGFKREGVLRKADDDGTDLLILGMLKEECRWLEV